VYDFSAEGLVAEIAEATGALFIPGVIGVAVWYRRRRSYLPFYVAIAVAAFGFLSGNEDRIKEAIDTNAYRREMAEATPENYRYKLAHSKTRLGQLLDSVLHIAESSATNLQSMFSALDDPQLVTMFTSETLLDRQQRSRLKERAKNKLVYANSLFTQADTFYSKMREDVVTKLADVRGNIAGRVLAGFDETRPESEKLLKDFVTNFADFYQRIIGLLDILDANDGKFTIRQDGKVIFADDAAAASYNQETADLQRDAANIQKIQERVVALRSAGIAKMIPALSAEH
jgi:hypothetical protein